MRGLLQAGRRIANPSGLKGLEALLNPIPQAIAMVDPMHIGAFAGSLAPGDGLLD